MNTKSLNAKSVSAKSMIGGREGLTLALAAVMAALRTRLCVRRRVLGRSFPVWRAWRWARCRAWRARRSAAGQARLWRFGNNVTITAANNTIINYNSFNIRPGESVNFVQPDAPARVLNPDQFVLAHADRRLAVGQRAGCTSSTPRACTSARGAVVNSGSIFAAAGNISNADFLRNINRFTDVKGKVVNEGTITTAPGGVAALVGSAAMNFGTISAPQGTIIMASGQSVLIGEEGWARLRPGRHRQGDGRGPRGRRGDRRDAEGPLRRRRHLRGRGVQTRASPRPSRRADGDLARRDGRVGHDRRLRHLRGRQGRLGRNPRRPRCAVNATIDASGDAKGGQVLIGGDLQGKGTQRNAALANVDSSSVVRADAITSGDGGKVIVWSDDTTKFQGLITARGSARAATAASSKSP